MPKEITPGKIYKMSEKVVKLINPEFKDSVILFDLTIKQAESIAEQQQSCRT